MIEKGEEKRRIDRWKERMEETKLESNVRGIGGIKIGIYYLPSIVRYGIAPNGITNLEPVSCQAVTGRYGIIPFTLQHQMERHEIGTVCANNLTGEYSLLDPSTFDLPSLSSLIPVKKIGVNRPHLGGCWPKALRCLS
ncbi:unnamed protein product [Prunus armeniaca]